MKKPSDRHRWFLTISDIERFFEINSKLNDYKYEILLPSSKSLKTKILGLLLNKRLKKELFTKYCWILITKN